MDFLKNNKDVLFEISKYLSRYDMIVMKKALPELSLDKLISERDQLLGDRDTDECYFEGDDLSETFNHMFELGDDKFLLYNRTFDQEKRLLICDIEFYDLENTYYIDDDISYKTFVNPILLTDGILLKIRNGHQWYIYHLDHQRYMNYEIDYPTSRITNPLISESYIKYLIETEKIYQFINDNLEKLSDINIYLRGYDHSSDDDSWCSCDGSESSDEYEIKPGLFLSKEITKLILYLLPEANRNSLIKDLKTYLNNGKNTE